MLTPWKKSYKQPRQHIRRRQWHPTPVLLPGKSHGWRGLVGCSPWGHWGSDMTERLHFHFSLSCIGEGNGNPLQCSCLENPRDGASWWAAVYGVTQSRTWLKWLSSSSSICTLCVVPVNASLGLFLLPGWKNLEQILDFKVQFEVSSLVGVIMLSPPLFFCFCLFRK